MSYLGNGPYYFWIFTIYLVYKDRAHSFYWILFLSVIYYIMYLGKIFYHNPRPYFTNDDIIAYDCAGDFGNPSGHSMESAFFLLAALDINKTYNL